MIKNLKLFFLLFLMFNQTCKPIIKKDTAIILASGTALAAGIISGYLIYKNLENKKDSAHPEYSPQANVSRDNNQNKTFKKNLKTLAGSSIISATTGSLLFWILYLFTPEHYKSLIKNNLDQVIQDLNKKLTDEKYNILTDDLNLELIKRYALLNFGENNQWPLVDAIRFLKKENYLLNKSIKYFETLKKEKVSFKLEEKEFQELEELNQNLLDLKDKISLIIQALNNDPSYKQQLELFEKNKDRILEKEKIEELKKLRRQNLNYYIRYSKDAAP